MRWRYKDNYKHETASIKSEKERKRAIEEHNNGRHIKTIFTINYDYRLEGREHDSASFHGYAEELKECDSNFRALKDPKGYIIGFLDKHKDYEILYRDGEYQIGARHD